MLIGPEEVIDHNHVESGVMFSFARRFIHQFEAFLPLSREHPIH